MRLIIALVLLFIPLVAQACPSAVDLAAGGAEPGAAALADCRELGRFEIPSGRGNIPVVMYGTRDSDADFIVPILESLTFAGDFVARLGALTSEPIDVFISPNSYVPEDDENALATATPSREGSDRCVISMFPETMTEAYRFVLAHEFFHCVQFHEFGERREASGADWWFEGTAEWFANYTYPGTGFSDEFAAEFDDISIDTPITAMHTTNVVFFFWYSETRGDTAIIDLIRAMPTGTGSQDDALAGLMDDEAFMTFAKAYFDREIVQPGGRPVPVVPRNDDTYQWDGDGSQRFQAARFVLFRARIEFACGEWELEERPVSGKAAVKRVPDGEWEDVPDYILPLEADVSIYRFIGVGTGAEGFETEIEAKKKPCSLCPRVIDPDSPEACLIGEWHLVSGGLGAKIGELLNSTELENVDYPDLDNVLIFNSDGSLIIKTEDEGHLESPKPSGDRIIGDVSFNFEELGTWDVNGKTLNQCRVPPELNINLDTFDTSNDVSERINFDEYLGPRRENRTSRSFNCEGNTLTITEGGFFAPRIEWVYSK